MATAPAPRPSPTSIPASASGKNRTNRRRDTSHLKVVPPAKALREQLRVKCETAAAMLDKSTPPSKDALESAARELLTELGLPEAFVGWTMVVLASAFWRDQVAATPPSRRLLLLPHCLRDAERCPAQYHKFGLACERCGACSIAQFRGEAEELGYKVLVAEGSPVVMKIVVSGLVDAIVGVACLDVLEKAVDKVLLAGVPCMALPLLSSSCRDSLVDEDWLSEMVRVRRSQPTSSTRTYLHLMRAASRLFDPDEIRRIAPPMRGGSQSADGNGEELAELDPIAGTEAIAYRFLAKGGKRARPFITLAVYDALTGGRGALHDGAEHVANFSDAVKRTAMSIETFHKASLVHDDIEDDDAYRYGDETLHRKYGAPTAINVGDYLIGMGYRFVSREVKSLGADVVADILHCLAEAHTRLCEGQGAELLWRDSCGKRLRPIDALRIYALKTAPAFEAAMYAGSRLAGPAEHLVEPMKRFSRNLGVAFQILNDLKDWRRDGNKRRAGGDILSGRPTLLWALALQGLSQQDQSELMSLAAQQPLPGEIRIRRIEQLYQRAGVFEKARLLVEKHQQRARAVADEIRPEELRRLFHYLIDAILAPPEEQGPEANDLELLSTEALASLLGLSPRPDAGPPTADGLS